MIGVHFFLKEKNEGRKQPAKDYNRNDSVTAGKKSLEKRHLDQVLILKQEGHEAEME